MDASKYANQGEWLETNYQVDNRYGLTITAKGLVDTWPQQPGGYMSGPMGTTRQSLPGQKVIGPITGQTYGTVLIGKIGADGEPFVIGDRYDGKPETEGKLYLHIGPSRWQCPSAGSFEVKISRKGE